MFDGSIVGVYEEVQENTMIKMKWKFKEWPDYADVVINFQSFNDSCEVQVSFSNIPERDNHGNLIRTESI